MKIAAVVCLVLGVLFAISAVFFTEGPPPDVSSARAVGTHVGRWFLTVVLLGLAVLFHRRSRKHGGK